MSQWGRAAEQGLAWGRHPNFATHPDTSGSHVRFEKSHRHSIFGQRWGEATRLGNDDPAIG